MDDNEEKTIGDDDQGEQKSAEDRIHDGYDDVQNARKLKNLLRGGAGEGELAGEGIAGAAEGAGAIAEGGAAVAEGATAATAVAEGAVAAEGGVAAAATSEIWVPLLIIILFILMIVVLFTVIFGGKISKTPSCSSITAESQTTSSANPVIITLDNCSPGATFAWSSSIPGGTLTPANEQSTNFTPPNVNTTTKVTITATICNPQISTFCSKNTITLTIDASTCTQLGGICTTSQLCKGEHEPTIPGATGCSTTTGQVCCNFNTTKFYCQYGAVNAAGHITSYGSWDYTQSTGKLCSIVAAGCAPTSFAMALSSVGYNITPQAVSQKNKRLISIPGISSENIGCRADNNAKTRDGTSYEDIFQPGGVRDWVKSLPGLTMSGDKANTDITVAQLQALSSDLNKGCLVVAGANVRFAQRQGLKSKAEGHSFMITGIDVANKSITVLDPTFCQPGHYGGERTFNNVTTVYDPNNTPADGIAGWSYATSICRN